MRYRKLGTTDLSVSVICLGTMTFGEQNSQKDAFDQMNYALERGVNFFDTAELYAVMPKKETYGKTEEILGNWFQEKKNRDKVILASKIASKSDGLEWIREGSENLGFDKKNMNAAIDASLKRLKTDYIDLYQLHWPERKVPLFGKLDFEHDFSDNKWTSIEEVLFNLNELVNRLNSIEKNIQDTFQNGRGTALTDFLYRGELDIITSNWEGYHRIFVKQKNSFLDMSSLDFRTPSRIRTVISADFDNDGYDEIFLNNIGQPNRLFRILEKGNLEEIKLDEALEEQGLGTGAAVADIDGDGILELLISHGESGAQPLSLFKANISNRNYIRIKPLNSFGAPARGATVILNTNLRNHAKTIDAGSGYLCQMEPVAHYGLRDGEKIENVSIKWTNGKIDTFEVNDTNNTLEFKQGI